MSFHNIGIDVVWFTLSTGIQLVNALKQAINSYSLKLKMP